MAGTVESMLTVKLSVKQRWWVRPFLGLAHVAVVPFWQVVDLDFYAHRVAAFVAKHGLKIKVG